MTHEERLQLLEDAMGLVMEAQELVDEAVSGTGDENHYRAYGRYGFDQLLGNGNPYDTSLADLAADTEQRMEEETSK